MKPTRENGIAHSERESGHAEVRQGPGRLGLAGRWLLVLAAISVAACTNFITGDDLKGSIQQTASEASAESVSVTISATPASGGTLSLSGLVTGKKVGVPFSLTAYTDTDYVFSGWTASAAGKVSFSNPSSITTTVTIGAKASDITISANFTARPKVIDNSPTGTGQLRNQQIYVQFDKTMDEDTFDSGTINVTAKASASGSPVIPILSYFDLETNDVGFTLTPTTAMPATSKITVTVSQDVTDLAGNGMNEDFFWTFTTGTDTDESRPTIDSFSVLKGQGTTSTPHSYLSSSAVDDPAITLVSSADSHSTTVGVSAMRIVELDETTSDKTDTGWISYNAACAYTLQTPGEGRKKLSLSLQNSNGLNSLVDGVVYVYLDRTDPVVSVVSLSSSNGSNAAYAVLDDRISVYVGCADPDIYSVTGTIAGNAVTGSIAGGLAYDVVTSTTEGAVDYTVTVTDYAGNATVVTPASHGSTTMSGAVYVDCSDPVVGTVSIAGGATYATSTDPVVAITATDSASGIVGYSASTTNGVPSSWTAVTSTTSLSVSPSISLGSDGTKTAYVYVIDAAGNISEMKSDDIILDRVAPSIDAITIVDASGNSPTHTNGDIKLTLGTVTEETTSVASYRYRADIGSATGSWTTFTPSSGVATFSLGGTLTDGQAVTVYVQATDSAGNTTAPAGWPSASLTLDTTGPTFGTMTVYDSSGGSTTVNGYTNGDITASFASISDASGVADWECRLGTSGGWVGDTNATFSSTLPTFDLSASGTLTDAATPTVYVRATDAVGNVTASGSYPTDAITIDKSAPTDVSGASGATGGDDYTVTLSWTNPGATDLARVYVEYYETLTPANTGHTSFDTTASGSPVSKTVTGLSQGVGYTFTLYAEDTVGNRSPGSDSGATASATAKSLVPGLASNSSHWSVRTRPRSSASLDLPVEKAQDAKSPEIAVSPRSVMQVSIPGEAIPPRQAQSWSFRLDPAQTVVYRTRTRMKPADIPEEGTGSSLSPASASQDPDGGKAGRSGAATTSMDERQAPARQSEVFFETSGSDGAKPANGQGEPAPRPADPQGGRPALAALAPHPWREEDEEEEEVE